MSDPQRLEASAKIDFKKQHSSYRAPKQRFELIDVPRLQYLMVDGAGDPNESQDFAKAVETLFPLAYRLKFTSKRELERDYVVMPLEALWWSDDLAAFTSARDKARWNWTLMVMTPDWIGQDEFETARSALAAKSSPPWLERLRLEHLDEGRAVQTLHVGPFDDEGETLARLHDEFVPAHGLTMTGKHHEIYLSDFRKTEPSKQRTILRQPVMSSSQEEPGGRS